MEIKDKAKTAIEKIDRHLHRALCDAEASEPLRAIVQLKPEAGAPPAPEPLDPADFPDRVAYRRAAIEQQARVVEGGVGGVKKKLEAMGLTVKGGQTSPTVVVEGTAEKLLDSLELEGVSSASLDRKVEMERPTKATGGGPAGG